MKWSFKLARFFDIDIYIHQTFLLLLLWFGFTNYQRHGTFIAALEGVLFIIALFACVVLHEYGHALTARRFGIKTKHITLLPIGGVAAMEKMPEKPSQELLIAFAGPAVNIIIAMGLYMILQMTPTIDQKIPLSISNSWLINLLIVNIFLAIFNLIPAFPMDGGRILRAALAMKMQYANATLWASNIGKLFAILFTAYGLYSNQYMLALIGVFLWLGATAENKSTQFKHKIKQLSIQHIMIKDFTILRPDDDLAIAERIYQQNLQQDFPIGDKSNISHVLSFNALKTALQHYDKSTAINTLSLSEVLTVDIDVNIQQLTEQLKQSPYKMIAVKDKGHVVGIIGIQQILSLADL